MVFSVVITHASSFSFSLSLCLSLALRRSCFSSFLFFSFAAFRASTISGFKHQRRRRRYISILQLSSVPKLVVFRAMINLRAKNQVQPHAQPFFQKHPHHTLIINRPSQSALSQHVIVPTDPSPVDGSNSTVARQHRFFPNLLAIRQRAHPSRCYLRGRNHVVVVIPRRKPDAALPSLIRAQIKPFPPKAPLSVAL